VTDREARTKAVRRQPASTLDYKRDFWATENRDFATPHFRLRKVARIVRQLAGESECDLLDLGCGPGTFERLLPGNVRYHGIDIAINKPAPNLIESDLLEQPIDFRGMKFDLVLAQGLFEYLGDHQARKFAEIQAITKKDGKFIATYMNFAHRQRNEYRALSNVREPADFRRDLERYFTIDRSFPGSHNWNSSLPSRAFLQKAQSRLDINIPLVSPLLAVDYFYVCSPRP
jgi:cyclopropane fatty-acyl-phospholipid synthase-like methyltransferase